MSRIVVFLRVNLINITLLVVAFLLVLGASLILFNRSVIDSNLALQKQTEQVKYELRYAHDEITRYVDVTIRGYAIIRNEKYLYISHEKIEQLCRANFKRLDSLLAVQHYQNPEGLKAVEQYKAVIWNFIDYHGYMVNLLRKEKIEKFKAVFDKDKGASIGPVYQKATKYVYTFEDELHQKAQFRYNLAMQSNIYIQFLIILIGLPTIALIILRLRKDTTQRAELVNEFETNNQKYLFHSGASTQVKNAQEVISNSIVNLRTAANFVTHISEGDYEVDWPGMTIQNASLNQANLAGKLLQMREQMKKVKQEEDKRNWVNEGLAQFSALVRNHQNTLSVLSEECIRFLAKYLNAQQGSIFVLTEQYGEKYLDMTACFAFDKKKFIEKRINAETGLLGQAYLEGATILLREIPQGYVDITSGLGEATPNFLIIVPMRYNDTTEAILELATFGSFEPHQVSFLEKCGEFLAAALLTVKTTDKMKAILENTQEQTEALRAQEEEMRQNMEEMQATQEEMYRKTKNLEEANLELEEKTLILTQLKMENEILKKKLGLVKK
ncbi:GAF domain-containing protein [Xanthocytophaga flava]|uniref:GAF domain-containing protein n=1 Tax=Xanthocytophaga flava TaxID=3048013 RepID=UPI0028D1AED9|nr:GAF domain-containing protein [Xanthocytophaga flavus]MDJ1471555.1 GAF domain-containing protein [Xanthocytophaga flavus]